MKLNQHLIVPALLGVVLVAQAADQPWFTRHLVGMEVGPTGVQFGHSDFNDVRCAARFDGRELDSTDNWVRFGKRDFGTETERKQRTSPAVTSKTLRSELQSP